MIKIIRINIRMKHFSFIIEFENYSKDRISRLNQQCDLYDIKQLYFLYFLYYWTYKSHFQIKIRILSMLIR